MTAIALFAAFAVVGLLLWLDRTVPLAGLWALLMTTLTVGFVHGALDAVLLPQRFVKRAQIALMFTAYFLLVLVLGWILSAVVSVALAALLMMSVWHFGEPYGHWKELSLHQSLLTRAAVGGAPVMLPVWLAPAQFAATLAGVIPELGLRGWHVLAWVWLGTLAVWLVVYGLPQMRSMRRAWYEVLGCTALYIVFSPLMAFAIYFGFYHAPVHIYRVWQACFPAASKIPVKKAVAVIALTTFITWLMGAGLGWRFVSTSAETLDPAAALRWLIVSFAALTAPHLVLISLCARFLTRPELRH